MVCKLDDAYIQFLRHNKEFNIKLNVILDLIWTWLRKRQPNFTQKGSELTYLFPS